MRSLLAGDSSQLCPFAVEPLEPCKHLRKVALGEIHGNEHGEVRGAPVFFTLFRAVLDDVDAQIVDYRLKAPLAQEPGVFRP